MGKKKLKFSVGDALQLQCTRGQEEDRYYVKVIGFLEHRSLIVTTPRLDGVPMSFREGHLFVSRLLSGNSVYGFETSVLRTSLHPYPYLHLAYPAKSAHLIVRKAHRAQTDIIVSVTNEDSAGGYTENQSARIRDISTAGIAVSSLQALGKVDDLVTVNIKLTVAGIEEYQVLPAVIRNCIASPDPELDDPQEFRYGLEFQLLEDQQTLVLHGFVNEQLVRQLT
ncbi:MAG: flagellar brake protein [Gammaproteobacteria bacterium]|nr:flagellar brake protein [Gammaproteobacteria bacterium]